MNPFGASDRAENSNISESLWFVCIRYDLLAHEDAKNVVLQCPCQESLRYKMLDEIGEIYQKFGKNDVFQILMGRTMERCDYPDSVPIWLISRTFTT